MSCGRTISGLISGLYFCVFLGISLTIWLQFNNKPLCKHTDIRLWLLLFVLFCLLNKVLKCFKCMAYEKYYILNLKGAKYSLNDIISVHSSSHFTISFTGWNTSLLLRTVYQWRNVGIFLGKALLKGRELVNFRTSYSHSCYISSCHGIWAANEGWGNHSACRGRQIGFRD